MSKAQCYYEILGISETATTDEVKQAYKKQALVWHPDKNQSNQEEAHAKFQVILKAYETLSDNREREWYDRHKDQILSDGDKSEADACINLFQYFSSACYANFDDAEDGFYTVYHEVFDQLKQEEEQAMQLASKYAKNKSKSRAGRDPDVCDTLPSFGDSKSSYEDIVRPFYAYWSSFCTNLTFDHLDKWNTTEAENRRILKAMDKENRKLKDAAKKERNTNVRNLVEFVKKRDRRLKAHKLIVEERNEMNRRKTAEKQKQQREKSLKNTSVYKPTSYLEMDDIEAQLQQLEEEYDDFSRGKRGRRKQATEESSDDEEEVEMDDGTCSGSDSDNSKDVSASKSCDTNHHATEQQRMVSDGRLVVGEDNADDECEDQGEEEGFFCPACSKAFRTIGAFENHEASKKHKQKVQKLTNLLKADESKLNK